MISCLTPCWKKAELRHSSAESSPAAGACSAHLSIPKVSRNLLSRVRNRPLNCWDPRGSHHAPHPNQVRSTGLEQHGSNISLEHLQPTHLRETHSSPISNSNFTTLHLLLQHGIFTVAFSTQDGFNGAPDCSTTLVQSGWQLERAQSGGMGGGSNGEAPAR